MMIKCKCGIWTNWGLTCSNCKGQYYKNRKELDSEDEEHLEDEFIEEEYEFFDEDEDD